ncbi:putative zinc metallopeptidase [Leptospira ellinghausenii]|uniref:Putative zinc metallopeptidase n=1 Tax=Leptospira ellinghausenii TaxID=1917822 RepID=A0A2P2DIQ2_9LEPT|nr:SprT-like domain-containing protein [Leptospira ellinghausenii]GBF44537.1 putative zinc metallopeptidase [Leptospira ellinghausenii]
MKEENDPTRSTYTALTTAYDFYNENLFESKLPKCLITLQRKNVNTAGYYSPKRFKKTTGNITTDEIAINPAHINKENIEDVLSTLVHEMTHLWQEHFGKQTSRRSYHNGEWGTKMETIGLMPSDTGKPGGKRTGQKMGDYVIENGLFQQKTEILLKNGFTLPWGEIVDTNPNPNGLSGKKVKYYCPLCLVNLWGKPGLRFACLDCIVEFQAML